MSSSHRLLFTASLIGLMLSACASVDHAHEEYISGALESEFL